MVYTLKQTQNAPFCFIIVAGSAVILISPTEFLCLGISTWYNKYAWKQVLVQDYLFSVGFLQIHEKQ